jgi:GntR family transcriptional regulator
MLNPASPIPLYHQLADLLMAEIRKGTYPPGGRIPSEHQLAATYRIGRPTARQATDLLVRRGILVRRRGSGTFVQPPEQEVDLFSLAGTSASFLQTGVTVGTRLLARAKRRHVGKDAHNPFAGREVFFFSRLSFTKDVPVLIEDFYLDPDHFPGLDQLDMEGRSLARLAAEHYYLRPCGGRQTFRIAYLAGARARHLQVAPKTPILAVRRYLNFPRAGAALYSELFCRTDRFVFAQSLGALNHEP